VTVRTRNGRTLVDRRTHPRGDTADPLSREEILAKFRESASGLLEPRDSERVIEMLIGLADLPRVSDLCKVLARTMRVSAAA
jgi:2-methylcitrate dehydratase PrpD